MSEKKCGKSKMRKLLLIFLPVGLVAALVLYGVAHSHGRGWHSTEGQYGFANGHGRGWHSSVGLETKMDWLAEDMAGQLELRPDQQEAYQALAEQFKAHVQSRINDWRATGAQLKDQFNKDTLEAGQIAALIKNHIRGRASTNELEALVERGVAFYQSLSPEQQERFRVKAAKHLNRHF